MKRRIAILFIAAAAAAVWFLTSRTPARLVLTGIVTTDSVLVGSEIQGRILELKVKEGDTVKQGDLLALIQPQEWQADLAFYANSEQQSVALVTQARAELKFQDVQTTNQIRQAEANLQSAEAQVAQASAEMENAKLTFNREEGLYKKGIDPAQVYDQARTAYDAEQARVESLRKLVIAAQAAVEIARANAEQTAARKAMLEASVSQLDAVRAQKDKAKVRLNYSEIRAPIDGIVDTRGALQGEVVNPAQGIVTLINPDDLWVRADVEETYIDRVKLGDKMTVRLPSGETREGTVFFRGVDADYATQRDVSRTKRDIKTFEIRLRCDNKRPRPGRGHDGLRGATFPCQTH
jgi:HlyD family secretion protein